MIKIPNYRAYFFVNMYLSSLQSGLQAAHCLAEMFLRYNHDHYNGSDEQAVLDSWGKEDKTIIILNGGNSADLEELYSSIVDLSPRMSDFFATHSRLPYAKFHEDKQSLNEALTCVGVIVPRSVYDTPIEQCKPDDYYKEMLPEYKLRLLLSKYRLAN